MSLPLEMRFIEAKNPGAADVLRVVSGALPQIKPHEVLIRVLAAGVNRPDIGQRKGVYPPPPDASPIIGLEVAGEVVELGAEVHGLSLGDKVCALTNGGGYAEYCAAPALQCLPWPHGFDAIRAAALPENYFTVWANIFQMARLSKGESLLVHGGSSGIGITAIQLAREFAGVVYATAGSAEKCLACEKLGATAAINYREQDFAERIETLTAGRGVDVILDIIGAPYFARNLRCLAKDGRLAEVATMQGAKVELDITELMRHRASVMGSMMRPRSGAEKGLIASELREQVWPLLAAGRCTPVIDSVFELDQVVAAHELMERSTHIGKIMLHVAD